MAPCVQGAWQSGRDMGEVLFSELCAVSQSTSNSKSKSKQRTQELDEANGNGSASFDVKSSISVDIKAWPTGGEGSFSSL